MNRIEFMGQLEGLLQNISATEREEALQYYNDYFNDAGSENEQNVIDELGSPMKVAENIKGGLYNNGYGENAYQRNFQNDHAVIKYGSDKEEDKDNEKNLFQDNNPFKKEYQNNQYSNNGYYNNNYQNNDFYGKGASAALAKSEKKLPAGVIVLIVITCVILSPVILGVAASILGTLVGILAAWFGLIIGFGAVSLVLLIMMVFFMILGIAGLFTHPIGGLGLLSGGLICGGLGILFLMLTVAMAGIVTPAIIKGIIYVCKKLFPKKTQKSNW